MKLARTVVPARSQRGFTLIELLVAVGLATILISTVVLIFYNSTDIFKISEARLTVFGNARAALDGFARDVQSAVPTASAQQRFLLSRVAGGGVGYDSPGTLPVTPGTQGKDAIQFRAIIPLNLTIAPPSIPATPTLRTVHVLYSLRDDGDPELLSQFVTGITTRTGRSMYILQKRVYEPPTAAFFIAPAAITTTNLPAADPSEYHAVMVPTVPPSLMSERADLCHYVLSFNLEYFTLKSPGPGLPGVLPVAPYGVTAAGSILSAAFTAGTPVGTVVTDRLPFGIRAMLRVVEGAGERQERLIVRTVWIPLS